MPGLKFLITGDDSPIRKTLDKLKKDTANAQKSAVQSSIDATTASKKQQKEVLDTINKQTAAIKKRNAEDAKRKPTMSNSAAEVAAYQKSKNGAPMTGPLVKGTTQQELINQFKELDVQQMKVTASYQAGRMSADAYNKVIDAMSKKQGELRTAIQNYNKGQSEAANATKRTSGEAKVQIGLLERLNSQLETYKEVQNKQLSVDGIAKANKKIQETQQEISRLNNIGKIGFDEFGRKIEGTTGKIDRLKRVAANYRLMADSSDDLKQIEVFNAKAQQATETATRLSNVGKKGFDELGNKIKTSGGLVNQMFGGLKQVANILPGIGIYGLMAFAIEPIMNYIAGLDGFKRKLTEAQKAHKTLTDTMGGAEYGQAIKRVQELTTNVSLAKQGLLDKNAVVKEYNEGIGKTAGQVKSLVEVEDFLVKNADAYVKMTLYKAAAQQALEEASKKAYEAEQARAKGEVTITSAVGRKGDGLENLTVIDRLKAAFAQDDGYTKELVKKRTKTIVDEAEKAGSEQERIALEFQKKAAEIAKQHKLNFFETDFSKLRTEENQYESALAKQKAMLGDIDKLRDDFNRKALTQEEEQKAAVVDRFAEMKRQLEAYNTWANNYNKKAPAGKKISTIDTAVLEPIKKKAIDDLTAQQEVERAKIAIEEQKQLFGQYEDYKLEYGKQKADERFGAELKGYTSYVTFLEGQLKGLEGKNDAGSNALKDFYNKELPKAQREASDKEYDEHMRNLARIMEATKTAANEEKRINEQYDKDLATLRKEYAGEELAEREKALADNRAKQLEGVRQLAWEQTQIAKNMAKDLFFMTRQELKNQIEILKNDLKDPSLTPSQKGAVKQALGQAKSLLKQANDFSEVTTEIAKYAYAAGDAFMTWSDALSGVNDDLSHTFGQVGSLANIAGDLITSLASGNPVAMVAGTIKAAAALFSMGKKVREMNAKSREEQRKFYEEAVKGERDYQELLRQRERDNVRRGKTSYQAIVAELELIKKQAPQVQAAYDQIFKSLQGSQFISGVGQKDGNWFRKAKTWDVMASLAGSDYSRLEQLYSQGKLKDKAKEDFEALRKLREELEGAGIDVENLTAQLSEMLTGTTTSGLADSLSELFQNGKLAAEDLGQSFEEIMKRSITNSFKYRVIEEAMQPFYENLAELMRSGTPTQDQIDALRQQYMKAGQDAAARYKELEQITGVNLTGGGPNGESSGGFKGAIKRELTEQTGSELTGLYRATYDLQKVQSNTLLEQRNLMAQKLSALNQIAVNTGATAENTARLAAIEDALLTIATNTKPSQSARDMGI